MRERHHTPFGGSALAAKMVPSYARTTVKYATTTTSKVKYHLDIFANTITTAVHLLTIISTPDTLLLK